MTSAFGSKFQMNKLINFYGQNVKIYNTSISTDNDQYITGDTYTNTIETKAWIVSVSGYREIYQVWGFRTDADYSAIVKATIDARINDVIVINDDTMTEVKEVIKHWEFNEVAFKELILTKISDGYT